MVMARLFNDQQNPVQQLQVKFKEVETGFNTWLSKQSLAVEVAVVSTMSGVQGAFICGLMGTLSHDMPQTGVDPQAIKQAQALVGGPWVQARNFGVNAEIACVMKRIRGKDDLESLRRFCSNIGMSQQAVKAAQEAVLKYDEFDIRRSPISIAAVVIYIITQLSDD